MSLRSLRWATVAAALGFVAALEAGRAAVDPLVFGSGPGHVLVGGLAAVGALLFVEGIFMVVGRMQGRLAQRNRELLALHEAGLAVAGELDLEAVLQEVVNEARDLVGARYGALSLLGPTGSMESFLTSGISVEERARIGAPPAGIGLLGVVLREGQRLRLADMARDPRWVGFPPSHPSMRSLLAVPILCRGRVLGNLYVTEKEGAREFSADDEETLVRFATQAALAITNARLHQQVQTLSIIEERERIAREMHDGLAQILGYVNTKAQAAQELLDRGQTDRAAAQINQLAEAARSAYADVRETILGLRTSSVPDRPLVDALREYVERWEEQSGVAAELATTASNGLVHTLPAAAEVQLLRIVQEALTNVRKHAGASHVAVRLTEANGWVQATVEDDGVGFDQSALGRAAPARFGLGTMRERAEIVGGTLAIDSAPGRGTRVTVCLPTTATTGGPDARVDR